MKTKGNNGITTNYHEKYFYIDINGLKKLVLSIQSTLIHIMGHNSHCIYAMNNLYNSLNCL